MKYTRVQLSSARGNAGLAERIGQPQGWPDWWGFRMAAWAGLALSVCLLVVVALRGNWVGVAVLAVCSMVAAALLLVNRRLSALVELLLVVAALLNAAGYAWDLYTAWTPFDKIVHGYTLFALTLPLGLLASGPLLHGERDRRLWFILVVASFGIALGALWEVAEWLFDLMMPGNVIQGKTDTITDIVVDTVGALLAGWICCEILSCRTEEEQHDG
jgi:VanZ family protein